MITLVYLVLFVGEKVSFAPPLPYLWSSACASACYGTDEQLLSEQLLPINWITGEEKQLLPGQLITQ